MAAACASADSSLRARKLKPKLARCVFQRRRASSMPKPLRPTRRRNARTAYECGAERSDFGRRGGDAQPRPQPASGAAAAKRSPERRTPRSERRRRPSGRAVAGAAKLALWSTSRASPIRLAPRRRRRPSAAATQVRSNSPGAPRRFLFEPGAANAVFAENCAPRPRRSRLACASDGQRRRRPRRRRRASQGLRIKTNPAIAGRPRAR